MMNYYIFIHSSLNGLGQYFEAVEVIDQIIDEVKLHETRMALHPMREFAKAQLLEDKRVTDMLGRFESLSRREQSQRYYNLLIMAIMNLKIQLLTLFIIIKYHHMCLV